MKLDYTCTPKQANRTVTEDSSCTNFSSTFNKTSMLTRSVNVVNILIKLILPINLKVLFKI